MFENVRKYYIGVRMWIKNRAEPYFVWILFVIFEYLFHLYYGNIAKNIK